MVVNMALVFSCIVPHTPLLMPTVGKEALALLDQTKKAMEQLEQEIYLSQPETVIVISPHGNSLPDAMVINVNPEYVTNFEEFGDLVTKIKWKADIMLVDRIREDFKIKHLPLSLDSSDFLDYGSAVPLSYLTPHLPQVKIIPLITSQLDIKTHYEFGRELKDEVMSSTRRVAIIASADLSHCVSENSPGGFSPRGVAFDDKVIADLNKRNLAGILDVDEAWATEAKACGVKALAILAGLMDEVNYASTVLSYEKPFGVGYVVASNKIS